MKSPKSAKIIFALFFFFSSTNFIHSQSGWFDLNVGEMFRCLYFVSDQTGWAVSQTSRILRTTNGGTNWELQLDAPPAVPSSVYFPTSSTGYVVGYANGGGVSPIYKTTNGGVNWVQQSSSTSAVLASVHFTDNNNGWIAGDSSIILHTTNSGSNWNFISSGGTNYYTCVQFISANTGWITGRDIILKTTNGGVNWINQQVPANSQVWEARFPTPSIGYAVCGNYSTGQGFVLKTTNGGSNWNQLSISTTNGYFVYLSFIDETRGWVTATNGTIARTTNGGINWQLQTNGQTGWLLSIFFINANTGWLTGSPSIFKTITGGEVGITPISGEVPKVYSLSQNYPNPFNPITIIEFDLPKDANIKITLYDVMGREVQTLASEFKKAGSYKLDFDGSSLSSGTYFYRLQAGEFVDTKKMVLIR